MIRKVVFLAAACAALAASSQVLGLVALASLVVADPAAIARSAARSLSTFAARLVALVLAVLLLTAQAQAASVSTIDVQPFLAQIIDLAIMVLGPPGGALALAVAYRLLQWLGVQRSAARDEMIRVSVDQGLHWAADYGRAKVGAAGPVPIEFRSDAIAHAADYAMRTIPGTLKKIGIADKASERLSAMVEARLGASF